MFVIAGAQDVDMLTQQLQLPNDMPLLTKLRQLDYQRVFAIIVEHGRTGDGHSVMVQRVTRVGNQVSIQVTRTERDPKIARRVMVTNPYQVVAVDKGDGWAQTAHFDFVVDGISMVKVIHSIP